MKKGDYVKETEYSHEGIIHEVFENWEDLKSKNRFSTVAPEADEMDYVEKIINGDPKDKWLEMQNKPFTDSQLEEKWFHVLTMNGGSIWSCESRLKLYNNT